MKQLVLSTLLMAISSFASAYDAQINGVCYNLVPKGNVAEVTSGGFYSNAVNIPEKFTYNGVEYSVTSIGNHAFQSCTSLTSVTIPNSVMTIGECAFFGCSGLTSINIPNSVSSIGGQAFSGCNKLTTVTIPNSVTSIDYNVFYNCRSLTSVVIPNSVTSIGDCAFWHCISLHKVTIPNSVTKIGMYAFDDCASLTSVIIPNSVTSIGSRAFYECISLTSVTIGNSVTRINELAFANCSKLEEVYCYAKNVPQTNTNAFENSYPQYAILYIPSASLNNYNTTAPWSEFGSKKTIGNSGDELQKCATPTISYDGKRLSFSCTTDGVEYVSEIKDADIKKYFDDVISLSATYEISVYATKSGYENSNVATATLVWTTAAFAETTESSSSAKAITESIPVLISSQVGTIMVKSEQEGQLVAVYSADGKALGYANISNGQATIATNLQSGQLAIVKVGNRSVKLKM